MNTIKEIKEYAKYLKLSYISNNIDKEVEIAETLKLPASQLVCDLLKKESNLRYENGKISRIRQANLPYKKYLDELNVERLPIDAKEKLNSMKSMDFVKNGQNIILAGNPGTGKTHLAIGLGVEAAMQGFKVRYYTVPTLINTLKELKSQRNLLSIQHQFESIDLIILDELGYISFDKEGAELLFTHLSLRAERKSTIITTNLKFDKWQTIFHDPIMTAAVIDRLTFKSFVVNMNGNSYRLQNN